METDFDQITTSHWLLTEIPKEVKEHYRRTLVLVVMVRVSKMASQ